MFYYHFANFVTFIVKNEFSFVLVLNVLSNKVLKKRKCLMMAYIKPKLVA